MTQTYIDTLTQAIDFTKSLGASVPSFNIQSSSSLLTAKNSAATFALIKKSGISSFRAAAGQCLKWSHALLPVISKGMGCQVLLTIGQLHINGTEIYNPSRDDFARWYRHGFQKSDFTEKAGFNLHCWYTLPSGEILDLTLWTTMGLVWSKPELIGDVVGGYPDEIAPNPAFIPVVVGCNYLESVARNTLGTLLSPSLSMSDLSAQTIIMVR